MFMLGYAYQKGTVPLGHAAIEQAIELNGAAVPMNLAAFRWGRRAAADPTCIDSALAPTERKIVAFKPAETLDDLIGARMKHLAAYQDARLAERYQTLVEGVRQAEQALGLIGLAREVALSYAKLLAYKDEYEVARLHTEAAFQSALERQFDGGYRLKFHLAPPLLAKRDPATGHLIKQQFGGWVLPLFRILARMKMLRGTRLDPFGYTAERRQERELIVQYETLVDELLAGLTPANHDLAVRLAALAQDIRGFGHVKQARLQAVERTRAELLGQWRNPERLLRAAE
jgi:indolepyruvate ferredoxin oxidoreductase